MSFQKFFFAIAFIFAISINAQENEPKQTLDSGTIENQFDYIINKSNRYQEYKVVKRVWLDRLKKVVNDSLNVVKKELASTKVTLNEKESEIVTLTNSLNTTKETVSSLNNEKDSINFFGMLISKPMYNTTLWSIITILLVALLFFVFKFNSSNAITKEANNKFNELEEEYETHKQRSLEREQQIRRKLQDEINKQKKDK
ncbi:MAG: tRNA (guanine-N1)-methyltransferase [Flavobacteriaceae bacterium]|nr:MAG: tRNA (guanine-N1)-methyltransferase [Flavobacteriaceae bacterium]